MWFGTFSSLGAKMWTRGLVHPLFMAQTMQFVMPDFCNTEGKWVGHGVKDHEVSDGNDVQVGFRLVEAPKWSVRSPLLKGLCQWGSVGWLGQGHVLTMKVPVVIIDGVRWEQNVEMLVWLGKNIPGCP